MSYEYTDRDGDKLTIDPPAAKNHGCVYIDVSFAGFYLKPEDAPAVALALLEAAGIEERDGTLPADALGVLRAHRDIEMGKAEREAEDAKVREFHRGLLNLSFEQITDEHRARYRAAREFFQQEDDENTTRALRELGICNHDDGTDYHQADV